MSNFVNNIKKNKIDDFDRAIIFIVTVIGSSVGGILAISH